MNPEDFLRNAARLIKEQKATLVVDHLTYSAVDEAYGVDIFSEEKLPTDSGRAVKTNRHIYDYVFTDSKNEREFVAQLDTETEIVVYAKLPRRLQFPSRLADIPPTGRSLSGRVRSNMCILSRRQRARSRRWSSAKSKRRRSNARENSSPGLLQSR